MTLSDRQVFAILSQFDTPNETVAVEWLVKTLRRKEGYTRPSRVVMDALDDEFLYVDSIDDAGSVFLGLTERAEEEWHSAFEEG